MFKIINSKIILQEVFESRINERMRVLEKYLEGNKNDVNKIRHDLEKSNRNDQVLDRFESHIVSFLKLRHTKNFW